MSTNAVRKTNKFSFDRYPVDDPVDKWGTLPHGEVMLGRGPPWICTGRPPPPHKLQTLSTCHQACRLTCQFCFFVQSVSYTGSLWTTDEWKQMSHHHENDNSVKLIEGREKHGTLWSEKHNSSLMSDQTTRSSVSISNHILLEDSSRF